MLLSLHATTGELATANDFFVTKAQAQDRQVRRGMIERSHPSLSIEAQCRLQSISRSPFYYTPQSETEVNLALMQLIDRQFLETPLYGVRQMTWHLQNEGHAVNVKRIRRLMRLMRLMPIYLKPDGLRVDRPNPVWWATSPTHRCGEPYFTLSPSWTVSPARSWPGPQLWPAMGMPAASQAGSYSRSPGDSASAASKSVSALKTCLAVSSVEVVLQPVPECVRRSYCPPSLSLQPSCFGDDAKSVQTLGSKPKQAAASIAIMNG